MERTQVLNDVRTLTSVLGCLYHFGLLIAVSSLRSSVGSDPVMLGNEKVFSQLRWNSSTGTLCSTSAPELVITMVRSKMECVVICMENIDCFGVNWKGRTRLCEIFWTAPPTYAAVEDCSFVFSGLECSGNPCSNGGMCTSMTAKACVCGSCWTGPRCQTYIPPVENLALGRPAYSTVGYLLRGVPVSPSLMTDGNFESVMLPPGSLDYQCFQTSNDAGGPNWVMVDLGHITKVDRVVLTGRSDDCCADRLDYFIVGITNISSAIIEPVIDGYPLCGKYPSTASLSAKMTQSCAADTPPGEYVIVQQPANGIGYLTICEIEVYGCYGP